MTYSKAFHLSVDLVLRVHELMRAGKGEDPQTNSLRADSEKPWYEMSDEEQDLVGGLSEDLYTLDTAPNEVLKVRRDIEDAIKSASKAEDYSSVLTIVRDNSTILPSAFAAHWRGLCWAILQHPNAGIPFFKDALRLEPDNGLHEYILLQAFLFTDRHEEGKEIALSIALHDENALLLYFAGMILFRCAFTQTGTKDIELLQQSIDCIERANSSRNEEVKSIDENAAIAANIWRSMAYDQLEQFDHALAACEYALKLDRTSSVASQLHDLLMDGKATHSREELLSIIHASLSAFSSTSQFSTAA